MSMIDDASDESKDALKERREHKQRERNETVPEDDEMSGNVPTANLE